MNAHIHRWLLPAPSGPIIVGVCACGASKEFLADPPALSMGHAPRKGPKKTLSQVGR